VVDQSYSAGDVDFKSQLTAIRGTKPEAIFVPGYYTEVGLIARQAKELGLNVPLMGGDGWDSPKLTEIGGKAIDNSYFSNHYSAEDQSPHIQTFIAAYKKAYGEIPDGLAAMGYDAMKVLADALNRAPEISRKSVRELLAQTKDYQGVTGKITIDGERNAIKSAVVLKVADGKYKYQTTINP
jgi:branched-chain amino acid transport system substrate-binding protein